MNDVRVLTVKSASNGDRVVTGACQIISTLKRIFSYLFVIDVLCGSFLASMEAHVNNTTINI